MIDKHPSEEVLQEFALGENLSEVITKHIGHCVECRAKISEYQMMFTKISEQERAVFDFNISELVLSQLNPEVKKVSWDRWLIYLAILSVFGLAGGILYVFSETVAELFAGFSNVLLYLAVSTSFIILLFQCVDMYSRYQRKINALDTIEITATNKN